MKLGRFQLALNHEDPSIVIQGLTEFKDRILIEHDAVESFGYYGRSLFPYQSLTDNGTSEIKGLLRDYLLSSSQIEELFILWKIPGQNENTELILAHTHCLTAILHCARSDSKCCDRIVARILSEFSRTITNQLSSGHQNIVHATLGLLLTMCSSSPQNSRDTYQKLLNHLPILQTLLQKGKMTSIEISGIRVQTESRHLIILLVFTVLYHCDLMIGNELISHKGLFTRIVNGIHKDNPQTILQIIQNTTEIINSSTVPYSIKINLIDSSYLNKLLHLPNDSDYDHRDTLKTLFQDYCHLLADGGGIRRWEGKSNVVINRMALLIKSLSPHVDLFHRELITIILKAKPFLLSKCMNAIIIPWDQPALTPSFITSLSYICYLLDSTDIDHSQIRNLSTHKNSEADKEVKKVVTTLCSSLLPSGFVKKDLSRLLQHQSPLLRRMGLLIILRIIQRTQRILNDITLETNIDITSQMYAMIQSHFTSTLSNLLPDVQLLFAIRTKSLTTCIKNLFPSIPKENSSTKSGAATATAATLEDTPDDSADIEQALYFHQMVLAIFEIIILTVPNLFQIQHPNFDFARFLEDIFPWPVSYSVQEVLNLHFSKSKSNSTHDQMYFDILLQTIRVLHVATLSEQCNWFGTKSDCVKLCTNLLVSSNWSNIKRTPLQRLLLLSSLNPSLQLNYTFEKKLATSAQQLITLMLQQSELFQAHDQVVVDMAAESTAWLQVLQQSIMIPERNWIILFEFVLRISYHWVLELCFDASQLVNKVSNGLLHFSPILYASIHFLALNFTPFRENFPTFIQNHIDLISTSQSNDNEHLAFFLKFIEGFQHELGGFISQLLLTLIPWICDPLPYLQTLSSLSQSLREEINIHSLPSNIFIELIPFFTSSLVQSNNSVDRNSNHEMLTIPDEPYSDMTIPLLSLITTDPNIFQTAISSFVDNWWCLISSVVLTQKESLSTSFLHWLASRIENEMNEMKQKSLNQKIELIPLCLRFIHQLTFPNSKKVNSRGNKRKKNDPIDASASSSAVDMMTLTLCRKITYLIMTLFISTDHPTQLIDALDIPHLLQQSLDHKTYLIDCYRQILISAAVAMSKESNINSQKIDRFWYKVFNNFNILQKNPDPDDLQLFFLSWSLQDLIQDPSLRASLVNHCIEEGAEGGGYELTTLSKLKKYHSSTTVYVKLPSIILCLLKSGRVDHLSQTTEKFYLDFLENEDSPFDTTPNACLSNALCHVAFTFDALRGLVDYCDVNSLFSHSSLLKYISSAIEENNDIEINQLQRIQLLNYKSLSLQTLPNNLFTSPLEKLIQIDFPLTKRNSRLLEDHLFHEWSSPHHSQRNFHHKIWLLIETILIEKSSPQSNKHLLIQNLTNIFHQFPKLLSNFLFILLNREQSRWEELLFQLIYPVILSSSSSLHSLSNWMEIYCHLLLTLLEEANHNLKEFKTHQINSIALSRICDGIIHLMEISLPRQLNNSHSQISSSTREQLITSLNKCLRLSLKFGLDKLFLLNFLFKFTNLVHVEDTIFLILSQHHEDSSSLLNCQQLLEMMISHSKFASYLQLDDEIRIPILRLILYTLTVSMNQNNLYESMPISCLEFLMQLLLPLYHATIQFSDRLIFRILHQAQQAVNTLHQASNSNTSIESIFSLPLPHYTSISNRGGDNFLWVTQALTPPIVYNTLTKFPLWRTATPAIFDFESKFALRSLNMKMNMKMNTTINGHSEESDDSQDENEEKEENEEDEVEDDSMSAEDDLQIESSSSNSEILPIDWHHYQGTCDSLDPSYWLPALHCCLTNCQGLSMRIFANCGALALTIAGLGSECPIIRTYSRSCLQIVHEVLQTQTPDKDSAFKERPQLILLVSFIRNYYTESNSDLLSDSYRLPVSQSIFLARSALHLLQPQHNLFSSVNKYLLSKPYCDVKDIPLYDMLVVEADVQNDSIQKVTALRLIRDCIVTIQDHLNMCRKNAYPRLMMSFLIFAKDTKIGHAILDIFEKAIVSSSTASRYLIERCSFISWLQQLSSSINDHNFSSIDQKDEDGEQGGGGGGETKKNTKENGQDNISTPLLVTAPLRLLSRVVCLLRKCLGVLSFLQHKGVETLQYQRNIIVSSQSILKDILLMRSLNSYLPEDYLKQTVLLLWDVALMVTSQGKDFKNKFGYLWRGEDILEFSKICREGEFSQNKQECEDMEISLLLLLAFRNLVSFDSITSVSGSRLLELSVAQLIFSQKEDLEDSSSYCLLTGINLYSTNTKDSKLMYLSPSNFIYNDCFTTFSHSAGQASTDSELKLSNIEHCMNQIEDRNWKAYREIDHLNLPLPCKLGKKFLVISTTRAVLFLLCSGNEIMNPLQYTRWALLMKRVYYDSHSHLSSLNSDFSMTSPTIVKSQVCQRIFSSFDEGFFDEYSDSYDQYLLNYHLTIISIVSFLNNPSPFEMSLNNQNSVGYQVWSTIQSALWSLLDLSTSSTSSRELRMKSLNLCETAKYFWNEDDDARRGNVLTLMELVCDLLSSLLTLIDRDSTIADENLEQLLLTDARVTSSIHLIEMLKKKSQRVASFCHKTLPVSSEPIRSEMRNEIEIETDSSRVQWTNQLKYTPTIETQTLGSFLHYRNLNYEQWSASCDSQTTSTTASVPLGGIPLLLEKMNAASSSYSLVGKKMPMINKVDNDQREDEEDEEVMQKKIKREWNDNDAGEGGVEDGEESGVPHKRIRRTREIRRRGVFVPMQFHFSFGQRKRIAATTKLREG